MTDRKTLCPKPKDNSRSKSAELRAIKSQPLLKSKKTPRAKITKIPKITKKQFINDILCEARSLGVSRGSAEIIAKRVYADMQTWMEQRGAITQTDFNREIAKKIKKYHADLSYLYENRGKII